jgi:hypothetical protein
MTGILFLFLDGVGLGAEDPQVNPFARARMPALLNLLEGRRLVSGDFLPLQTSRVTLLSLDACLGVDGLPQSATGQAALLTGLNVPALLGYHYGPKPNPEVAAYLNTNRRSKTVFYALARQGKRAALLNAYPPSYFQSIHSGRRLYSAIPLAAISAGLALMNEADLYAGRALSADFTARGWRQHLGFHDVPELTPYQAGERLAILARHYELAFFEYWLSDYAGHAQDMDAACALLETLDSVLAGLLAAWALDQGLLLITSDHGNL